jgi:hypothetical protein
MLSGVFCQISSSSVVKTYSSWLSPVALIIVATKVLDIALSSSGPGLAG